MTREADAKAWLAGYLGSDGLWLLGEGREAVVFTDKERVFKVFTSWTPRADDAPGAEELLVQLADRGPWRTLYPVVVERQPNGLPLVTYPYEPSVPYGGGAEADVICFLREARAAGFVMSNVHPDNFIMTATGLRLVDYGASFHPWSPAAHVHMVRRAWLMLRCFGRGDLKALMRAALTDQGMPELTGFEDFLERVDGPERSGHSELTCAPGRMLPVGQETVLDPRVISMALASRPSTAFDYGCGKGKVAIALERAGVAVTGWDPDKARMARCRGQNSRVRWLDGLDGVRGVERFDVVICSIVACIVPDGGVPALLHALRGLVAEGGRVVLSICDPFYSLAPASELHEKVAPPGSRYRGRFAVASRSLSSGGVVEDLHRPWAWYRRHIAEAGMRVVGAEETEGCAPGTGWPHPDYLIALLEPVALPSTGVSLLIRASALEADTIDAQVRHIVRQLGGPTALAERIVVVDPQRHGFAREHGRPDLDALLRRLDALVHEGVLDAVVVGPEAPEEVRALNARWFDLDVPFARASNGQAVATALLGFERARHPYVVAVDADVMILRDPRHDPIREAITVLQGDERALTASLNILSPRDREWSARDGAGHAWRVEVRAAVFHRERLLGARPLSNSAGDAHLERSWHRALDSRIDAGGLRSWRGGDRRSGFVHPPNALKWPRAPWLQVMGSLEAGWVPAGQLDDVDLLAVGDAWCGPPRDEEYIFVVCGRNVEAGRIKRCLDSLCKQRGPAWGAIVIDDASDNGAAEYLELLCTDEPRITLIRNRVRMGALANLHQAVHRYVARPDAVILTLDMDDALLGGVALARVAVEYDAGADMTVGSMRRTDKDVRYVVDFTSPRARRGGNVWQHLRTFRKHLFAAIREEDLHLDGEWIELASDWAFMVPIVEMARRPAWIEDLLYLYEPSPAKAPREADGTAREAMIARIMAKPSYTPANGGEP